MEHYYHFRHLCRHKAIDCFLFVFVIAEAGFKAQCLYLVTQLLLCLLKRFDLLLRLLIRLKNSLAYSVFAMYLRSVATTMSRLALD
jgi:hypothetical protein